MAAILVIEDEPALQLLYTAELTDDHHQVQTASTAEEALQQVETGAFDLLVLDIHLGQVSGLELLQKIKEIDRELPVILCSAYSCYKEDFASWLADAYVVKSSDLSELKSEITRLLQPRSGS